MNYQKLLQLSRLTKEAYLSEVEESMHQTKEYLVANQLDQWDRGVNKDGDIIGRYTKNTELIAKKSNPIKPKKRGQPYNLQWTGGLFRSAKAIIQKDQNDVYAQVIAKSDKIEQTIDMFGSVNPSSIYGLTKENKELYKKELNFTIKKRLKKYGL